MSINAFVGAFALAGLLFAPANIGIQSILPGVGQPQGKPALADNTISIESELDWAKSCQSHFGPTGNGWAAHRQWKACRTAGREDHPYVSLEVARGPHFYLDVGEPEHRPHDDF